ncbi:hypothetical protein D3C73_1355850 [compost metagenome]
MYTAYGRERNDFIIPAWISRTVQRFPYGGRNIEEAAHVQRNPARLVLLGILLLFVGYNLRVDELLLVHFIQPFICFLVIRIVVSEYKIIALFLHALA